MPLGHPSRNKKLGDPSGSKTSEGLGMWNEWSFLHQLWAVEVLALWKFGAYLVELPSQKGSRWFQKRIEGKIGTQNILCPRGIQKEP